jgi:hypothetical protein
MTLRILQALLLVLGVASAFTGARAQDDRHVYPRIDLNTGDQIRITALETLPRHTLATFVDVEGDALVIRPRASGSDTLVIPVGLITELEVNEGESSKMRQHMGYGTLIGMGVGAIIGFASGGSSGGLVTIKAEETAVLGAVFFGAAGLTLGAISGAMSREESWKPVSTQHLSLAIRPDAGVGFNISFDF